MVAVNSLLYFLLSAGLSANPEQDVQNYETLNGMDIGKFCPPREKLSECEAHCQKNCTNYNKPIICPRICVKGCVCDEGLVRGADGKCILPKQCPAKDTCPRGEHYVQCDAHCQWNCTNYGKPIPCPRICAHGCVCNAGTVRGPNGRCIKPDTCPKKLSGEDELTGASESFCPVNEVHSPCLAHCQRDCSNWDDAGFTCPKMCSSGCICERGMVRGPDGACVKPNQCTPKKEEDSVTGRCPRYEKYSPCSSHCQKNCSNYKEEVPCTRDCNPGCICEDDRVRGPDGKCIWPNDCPWIWNEQPGVKCPKGEHYDRCQLYCQKNCSNYNQEIICPLICAPGCVCNIGLVRGGDGRCINPDLCPKKEEIFSEITGNSCPEGEHYDMWMYDCQKNCSNWNRPFPCPRAQVPGCICNTGTIRSVDGRCITPDQCPKKDYSSRESREEISGERCPRYEKYSPCSAHCQKNCSNYKEEVPCTRECRPGCICEDDRVRGPDGKCIWPNDCPWIWNEQPESEKSCPPKEHLSECNAHCQKNCTNFNKPVICPRICVKGCVCDEGLVRGQDGKCAPPKQCPGRDVCPRGEHYDQCNAHCQRDCLTWDKPLPCPLKCQHGCVCDRGTVRGPNRKCIRPDQCPKKDRSFSGEDENGVGIIEATAADFCPTNEEYSPCSAHCETDCRGREGICSRICVSGCRCKRGFVRGPKGTCIKREECTKDRPRPRVCPENERFDTCRGICQLNCTTLHRPVPCPLVCFPACICKEGLIRGLDGKCIPRDQCPPPNHQSDEEVSEEESTRIYEPFEDATINNEEEDESTWIHATVKDDVPFSEESIRSQEEVESTHSIGQFPIPILCKRNEIFSVCPCAVNCDNYETKKCSLCEIPPKCECKSGYVVGPDDTCIRKEECPRKKPDECTELEFYDSCGSPCPDDCTNYYQQGRQCANICKVGCFCIPGRVRGPDGNCIFPYECTAQSPFQ